MKTIVDSTVWVLTSIIKYLILFLIGSISVCASETPDFDSLKSNQSTAILSVSALHAGVLIASFARQQKDYWSEPSVFHIMDLHMERDDALYADKAGHLSFAYTFARTIAASYVWAGMNKTDAQLLGSGISLFHQTAVEIQDGFSSGKPYLGFSRGDMIANIVGAYLPVLQMYNPAFDCFRLKFSFNSSNNYSASRYNSILNDYTSTYHWLSVNLHNVLPKEYRTSWTPYLAIALGHSVKDINRAGSGNHELWLSLDLNAEALPGNSAFMKMIKTTLQTIKLPMPCIRILPSIVWYGLRI